MQKLIFSLTQISFGLVNLKRLRFISELTFMHGGRVGLVRTVYWLRKTAIVYSNGIVSYLIVVVMKLWKKSVQICVANNIQATSGLGHFIAYIRRWSSGVCSFCNKYASLICLHFKVWCWWWKFRTLGFYWWWCSSLIFFSTNIGAALLDHYWMLW